MSSELRSCAFAVKEFDFARINPSDRKVRQECRKERKAVLAQSRQDSLRIAKMLDTPTEPFLQQEDV